MCMEWVVISVVRRCADRRGRPGACAIDGWCGRNFLDVGADGRDAILVVVAVSKEGAVSVAAAAIANRDIAVAAVAPAVEAKFSGGAIMDLHGTVAVVA